MNDDLTDLESVTRRLQEILAGHMIAIGASGWPGSDGLTVSDLADYYAESVAVGRFPDWVQLLSAHPELSATLYNWLSAKDRWPFAFPLGAPPAGQGESQDRDAAE